MTERELLIGEMNALKSQLCDTDYKALKYAEGEITVEDYAETKANRQTWRARINAIEEELANLPEDLEDTPSESEESIF